MASIQYIVVDQLEISILQGDHDLGLLDIFRIHIIVFRDLRHQDTCQLLLQQMINRDLIIRGNGGINVIS